MLTWLADEVVRGARSEKPFETWLQDKQLDGAFLTVGEKKKFKEAISFASEVLKKGTMSFVEAFAKGLGSS